MKEIIFYSDCAKDRTINTNLDKDEVMLELLCRRNLSTLKSIKKNCTEKCIRYELDLDDKGKCENNVIIFPKKYIEQNQEYIKELDKWIKFYKKTILERLKVLAIACAFTVVGTYLVREPLEDVVDKAIEDVKELLTDEVADLEWEILIHSGHAIVDTGKVSPIYDHGCKFIDNKSISVEKRIELYCEEHNLEYLQDEALLKYKYLFNDEMELGNSIDLKKIEKQHKKSLKQ